MNPSDTTASAISSSQQQQQLPSNFRPAKQINSDQSKQSGHLSSVQIIPSFFIQ